jgi:hypothetical protein
LSENHDDPNFNESQKSYLITRQNELPEIASMESRPDYNSESEFLIELCDKMDKKKREVIELALEN